MQKDLIWHPILEGLLLKHGILIRDHTSIGLAAATCIIGGMPVKGRKDLRDLMPIRGREVDQEVFSFCRGNRKIKVSLKSLASIV